MRTPGTFARIALSTLALAALGVAGVAAQEGLTLEQARTAVNAAEAEARANGWNLTILVADADGVPIYLRRMDGASPRTHEIATRKAMTSLASGMSTGDYGQALEAGRADEVPDGVTFAGGYPIRVGDAVVGAMSASGARAAEDAQAVRAGLAAIGIEP